MSSTSHLALAVVTTIANEELTILDFIDDVFRECGSFKSVTLILVFDQSCTDHSYEMALNAERSEKRLKVVFAEAAKCPTDAYLAGFRFATTLDVDWVLDINGGYRHDPSDLAGFLPHLDSYDCVFGSRFSFGGRIENTKLVRLIYSKGGTIVANMVLGTKLTDMTSGYQMFRKETLEWVLSRGLRSKYHFLQTEIKFHCRDFKIKEVPIKYKIGSGRIKLHVIYDAVSTLFMLAFSRLKLY